MSGVATAVVGGAVVGGLISSDAQKSAANTAAGAQTYAAELSVEETKRQFDEIQKLLEPYVSTGTEYLQNLAQYTVGGTDALRQQQALTGLLGNKAQSDAIRSIEQGSMYQDLARQGEEAILQQASATGGLRGGNTQAALAQYRPQLLQSLIEQQYSRLGGLTALGQSTAQNIASLGQASAAQTGAAGMQSAANISNALTQSGQAQAAAAIARGQATADLAGSVTGGISNALLYNKLFGGGASGGYTATPIYNDFGSMT